MDISELLDKSLLGKGFGLVLAGGGGKGAYQIGAFKALSECTLINNILGAAGTSVGALNMCILAQNNIDIGEKIWKKLSPEKVLTPDLNMLDLKEGVFSREGLIDIMDNYIDISKISKCSKSLFTTVSRFDSYGEGTPTPEYLRLNNMEEDKIKKVLLASSALPILYEPVNIEGGIYRDGGITDNLPIKPLYNLGIKHFIVVCLSNLKKVPVNDYPDAEFIIIKPTRDLGDLLTGTLDFSCDNAILRMQLGYYDTVRVLKNYSYEFSKTKDYEYKLEQLSEIDYPNIVSQVKIERTSKMIEKSMKKFNDYINKFTNN